MNWKKSSVSAFLAILILMADLTFTDKKNFTRENNQRQQKLLEIQEQEKNLGNGNKKPDSDIPKTRVNPKYIVEDSSLEKKTSNRVVVKIKQETDPENLAESIGAEVVRTGPLQFVTLALPVQNYGTLLEQLTKTPGVLGVDPEGSGSGTTEYCSEQSCND